ncbi:MAG: prepilin-type N-terminal cleavage/methylation domain-containing protein [Candidatus Eisenbacteria bacterium]
MKCSRSTGFTLVELLVAVSLFSLLVLSVYSSFSTGLAARKRAEAVVEVAEQGREVLSLLSRDLSDLVMFAGREFSGEPEAISFVALQPFAEGSMPVLSHVTYDLSKTAQGSLRALRRGCEIIGGRRSEGDLTAPCVRNLSFSYARLDGESNVIEWASRWSPTEESPIPYAVRVELGLAGQDTTVIKKIIQIPIYGAQRRNNGNQHDRK